MYQSESAIPLARSLAFALLIVARGERKNENERANTNSHTHTQSEWRNNACLCRATRSLISRVVVVCLLASRDSRTREPRLPAKATGGDCELAHTETCSPACAPRTQSRSQLDSAAPCPNKACICLVVSRVSFPLERAGNLRLARHSRSGSK